MPIEMKPVGADLFDSEADLIVIPVNVFGAMGKGIALQFKEAFPALYHVYKDACADHALYPGDILFTADRHTTYALMATKDHWRQPSKVAWVEKGLRELADALRNLAKFKDVRCIGVPAVGCGEGKLPWSLVRPLIEKYLGDLPQTVYVYPPRENIRRARSRAA